MIKQITISVNTDPHASAGLVTVDGRDVTRQALDPSLASRLARIASIPQVRRELAGLQRQAAGKAAVVLGRDIGTVIFPEAKPKFFLTASPAERMKRRRRELELASGRSAPDALLEEEVEARDRADSQRESGPLRAAPDAIILATEGKTVHQVLDEVIAQLPGGR
jgi:pantoate ligase/cytidylate kinase